MNILELNEFVKDMQYLARLQKHLEGLGIHYKDTTQADLFSFIHEEFDGVQDRFNVQVPIDYSSELSKIISLMEHYKKVKCGLELLMENPEI